MGLWWNLQTVLMKDGISPYLVRMISGFMAGILLIPLSFLVYGVPNFSVAFLGSICVAIGLNVVIAYCFVAAAQKNGAAIGSHVQVFGPIVSLFVGKMLLSEFPNVIGILGMFITLIGLYFFQKGPIKKMFLEWKSWLGYAVLLAFCSGFAVPFDKINILLTNSMLAPGLTLFFGWGMFYLFAYIVANKKKKQVIIWNRKTVLSMILLGLFFGVANMFQGLAYKLVPTAAMVGVLKRTDGLWTVLFCLTLFKQNSKPFRVIGAVIIFVGLVIMGLSNFVK